MNFKPILFSGPMVCAGMAGLKTETRRLKGLHTFNENPDEWDLCFLNGRLLRKTKEAIPMWVPTGVKFPYGVIGDILWVRETLYQNGELGLEYVADREDIDEDLIPKDFNVRVDELGHYKFCKIPSIYMQKWACRLFLKIKDIKIERLQNISDKSAISEGIFSEVWNLDDSVTIYRNYLQGKDFYSFSEYGWNFGKETHSAAVASYCSLWCDIHGVESWNSNPWVWVIEFEKINKPDSFL